MATDGFVPACRCGHQQIWHAYPPGDAEPGPDTWFGACEITGPQPGDGCDCPKYRPAPPGVTRPQKEPR